MENKCALSSDHDFIHFTMIHGVVHLPMATRHVHDGNTLTIEQIYFGYV